MFFSPPTHLLRGGEFGSKKGFLSDSGGELGFAEGFLNSET